MCTFAAYVYAIIMYLYLCIFSIILYNYLRVHIIVFLRCIVNSNCVYNNVHIY